MDFPNTSCPVGGCRRKASFRGSSDGNKIYLCDTHHSGKIPDQDSLDEKVCDFKELNSDDETGYVLRGGNVLGGGNVSGDYLKLLDSGEEDLVDWPEPYGKRHGFFPIITLDNAVSVFYDFLEQHDGIIPHDKGFVYISGTSRTLNLYFSIDKDIAKLKKWEFDNLQFDNIVSGVGVYIRNNIVELPLPPKELLEIKWAAYPEFLTPLED